ncbi:MAG TPA: tripartite tricarboxylate transporter substrate binding protein [Burkholderiales bacterium]|nr:tripartite tricarboxylate transporter substrate binding protein [Burkholderiales bacterium]
MTMKMREAALCLLGFAAACVLAAVSAALHAQSWPARPVRMIVPFGTGGGTDIQARLLAESFRQSTGQTFITDNRAGAGGIIGAELAAQSPPDGYTILFTTASLAVNTTLFAKTLKFDPRADLAPVSWVSSTPLVLCVHPSVPARSVNDLISLARKNPGRLNNGVNATGTTSHLAGEMLKQMVGLDTVIIAFKGGGPSMQALMTGEIDFLFATGPVAATNLKVGRIRCLAVTSPKKSSAFPDLPTMASFVPGFEADNWYAMFFPRGTPQEIVGRMNQLIRTALQNDKVATFYQREALDAIGSSPAELAELFEREVRKYAEVIRKANIKVQ